jgi:hypothetical protein
VPDIACWNQASRSYGYARSEALSESGSSVPCGVWLFETTRRPFASIARIRSYTRASLMNWSNPSSSVLWNGTSVPPDSVIVHSASGVVVVHSSISKRRSRISLSSRSAMSPAMLSR